MSATERKGFAVAEVECWIGLDVGKANHHATVLDASGTVVFDRPVGNDERSIEALLEDAGPAVALVIDQPGSIGSLRRP